MQRVFYDCFSDANEVNNILILFGEHITEIIVPWKVFNGTKAKQLLFSCIIFPHLYVAETIPCHICWPFKNGFVIVVDTEG